jgi:hypothetical protein
MDDARIKIEMQMASAELACLGSAVALFRIDPEQFRPLDPEWAVKSHICTTLQSVYTGIESALMVILKNIDNFHVSGDDYHRQILDRSACHIDGVRPAIISPELKPLLVHLMGFRHVVRKRYGNKIQLHLALENFDRAEQVMPMLQHELDGFFATLAAGSNDHMGL